MRVRNLLMGAVTIGFAASLSGGALSAENSADLPQPAFEGQTNAPKIKSKVKLKTETLATGIIRPRTLSLMPDGSFLLIQRDRAPRILDTSGNLSDDIQGLRWRSFIYPKSFYSAMLDPNFARNRVVYLAYFEAPPGEEPGARPIEDYRAWMALSPEEKAAHPIGTDRIVSAVLSPDGAKFTNIQPILSGAAGRRLLLGSDGTIFTATMGATGDEAQRLDTLEGKVLRVSLDGSIPGDNPFAGQAGARQEIYSYGHRDPDGLAFQPGTKILWEHEHGPKGGDELNIIRPGANYGWPVITYGTEYSGEQVGDGLTQQEGMEQPVYYWDPDIAPSSLMFYTGDMFPEWQGSILIGGLISKDIVRLVVENGRVTGEERLLTNLDRRIRDIQQGPDGELYVLTDSEDNNETNRHFPGTVIRVTRR